VSAPRAGRYIRGLSRCRVADHAPFAVRRRPDRDARPGARRACRRREPGMRPGRAGALGRALKVAHFVPGPGDDGKDPAGVVMASSCKRMPDDPRLTLAAVGWDAHEADSKALAIAIVDESAARSHCKDDILEDAATQVNERQPAPGHRALRLAPGVRAFGVDIVSDNRAAAKAASARRARSTCARARRCARCCRASRSAVYLRGNQPRCVAIRRKPRRPSSRTTTSPSAWARPARAAGATWC
jgi:hypothetical protein